MCLIQDVSESERMEQMRRDYVANVSHELRTPLAVLCSRLEIALRRPREDAQLRGTIEETLEGLSSLCRLVELLLTLAVKHYHFPRVGYLV